MPSNGEVRSLNEEEYSSGSSQSLYSSSYRDTYDYSNDIELNELLENNKSSRERSDSSVETLLEFSGETNWQLLSRREKWRRFWCRLWNGPVHPEDLPPRFTNAYLSALDALPKRLKDAVPWKAKVASIILYLILWYLTMYSLLKPSLTLPATLTTVDGTGRKNTVDIVSLSCNDENSFWKGKNAACGLGADECKPFEDRDVVFRCPALCDRGSWTYSSIPIGNQSIKYRGYFVGGGLLSEKSGNRLTEPYRSDSFPCGAATHAGILSPFLGGCAKVSYIGPQPRFPSTKGHYGVDDSIAFDSFFPSSYVFTDLNGASNCYDPRLPVTVLNIIFGFPIMFLCSGFLAFWIICTVGFWTICLALDPPIIINVLDSESLPTLISLALERYLPTVFILYTLWHFAIGNTLNDPVEARMTSSPVSKTFIWYPLFWLGIANNVTFDRLPVDRLTLKDIKEQPGSLTAILSIIGTIVTCAIIQAYRIWKTGKFKKYLCIYIIFILGLVIISQLRGLTLRIHHYILAMLLIPGTGTRGFSAMFFQGLLVGLFLSGTSRWGLASIAETTRALRRSDPSGTIEPPLFSEYDNSTSFLSWVDQGMDTPYVIDGEIQHPSDELNGYSLLINDVEWYKGNSSTIDLESLIMNNTELKKMVSESLKTSENIKLYLRLSRASLSSRKHSDYTRAAVLKWPSGAFDKPEPGLT